LTDIATGDSSNNPSLAARSEPAKKEGEMKTRKILGMVALGVLCLAVIFSGACSSTMSAGATKSIVINAPPEKIYNYVMDLQRHQEWDPEGIITNIEGSGLGRSCDVSRKVAGKEYKSHSVIVDVVPNQRIVEVDTGDVNMTLTTLLLPVAGGTKVTVIGTGFSEVPAFAKAASKKAVKEYEKSFEEMMKRVKAAVEKP
jgi:uncharacterized protein YndB with AHSA1/START domain